MSEYSAGQLGASAGRTRVIYGGADPARFRPRDAVGEGVLYVGRLTPHKGVDVLLSALPAGARLLVAGSEGHDSRPPESGYPRLLRQLAAGRRVEFLGPVSETELPRLYASARVLVLPSVHRTCYGRRVEVSELLGLVAIEAMAAGIPVVASRLGGLPEVVEDGVTGFLVTPGDPQELGDRLRQLLADPGLAHSMGRAGRRRVLQKLTWEACADRCLAAYLELVG